MKQQVLKFLKEYSTLPLEVDRLIVSTYITVNNLRINNNIYLKDNYLHQF